MFATNLVGRAAGKMQIQCRFEIDRMFGTEYQRVWHNPVKHNAADIFRIAFGVLLRHASTIRNAVQIDFFGTDFSADNIEIVYRVGGRIKTRIGTLADFVCTLFGKLFCLVEVQLINGLGFRDGTFSACVFADQGIGFTRATLIYKNNISFLDDICKYRMQRRITFKCRLARSAGQHEHRIRLSFAFGGNPGQREFNLPAFRLCRIFRDL